MGLNTKTLNKAGTYAKLLRKKPVLEDTIALGFEWEIPLNECMFGDGESRELLFEELDGYLWDISPNDFDFYKEAYGITRIPDATLKGYNGPMSREWLRERGYRSHFECGGFEIDSPVFYDLNMAKGHARNITKYVKSLDSIFTDGNDGKYTECGIHVHVSDSNNQRTKIVSIMVNLLLNRGDNRDFLTELSGRFDTKKHYYSQQAEPDGWDSCDYYYSERPIGNNVEPQNEMVRTNCKDGSYTMELRLFETGADRLPVAIETAHSLFKYARGIVNKKPNPQIKDVPTLGDYRDWLFKQRGYKTLKNYANWNLI